MSDDQLMTQEELDALLQEHQRKGDSLEPETNDYLSVIEQDTLAEIGNISMGSAATVLSTLANHKVRITVPKGVCEHSPVGRGILSHSLHRGECWLCSRTAREPMSW